MHGIFSYMAMATLSPESNASRVYLQPLLCTTSNEDTDDEKQGEEQVTDGWILSLCRHCSSMTKALPGHLSTFPGQP